MVSWRDGSANRHPDPSIDITVSTGSRSGIDWSGIWELSPASQRQVGLALRFTKVARTKIIA